MGFKSDSDFHFHREAGKDATRHQTKRKKLCQVASEGIIIHKIFYIHDILPQVTIFWFPKKRTLFRIPEVYSKMPYKCYIFKVCKECLLIYSHFYELMIHPRMPKGCIFQKRTSGHPNTTNTWISNAEASFEILSLFKNINPNAETADQWSVNSFEENNVSRYLVCSIGAYTCRTFCKAPLIKTSS